jgi:hypothetical protein
LYGPCFASNDLQPIPYPFLGINFTPKFGKMELKKAKSEDNLHEMNAPNNKLP